MKPTNTVLCLKSPHSAPAHSLIAKDGCLASRILAVVKNFRFQIDLLNQPHLRPEPGLD